MRTRRSERGEGQVGCLVMLVVLLVLGMVTYKILPPYMSYNNMADAAKEVGSGGGTKTPEEMMKRLRERAVAQEVPELLEEGAMTLVKQGDNLQGSVTITLRYTREVDLYGVTKFKLKFDKQVVTPYLDAR